MFAMEIRRMRTRSQLTILDLVDLLKTRTRVQLSGIAKMSFLKDLLKNNS